MRQDEAYQQELEHQQWLEENSEYEAWLDKNGYFNGWTEEMERNFEQIMGDSDGNK